MLSSIQTHLLSIAILMVIYVSIKQQTRAVKQKNRYFLSLVVLNIITMILKIAINMTKGYTFGFEAIILHTSVAAYYATSVVVVLYFLFYLHYHVEGEAASKRNLMIAYTPFMVMAFTVILLSFIGIPAMYQINAFGLVERRAFYGPVIFTEFFTMIGSIVYVIWHKRELNKVEFITLILYLLPPAVGVTLSEFFSGIDLIWPSMTLSLLMIYVNIQSRMTNTDPLTGVFNRREYEKQLYNLTQLKSPKKKVCAILIDIDDFKQINDNNSHQVGDSTLIDISNILQRSIRKNDFIARIGGDEFCIIIESDQDAVLHDIVNRINHQLDMYNADQKDFKNISLSMGYGMFDPKVHPTFDDFFLKLDYQMYENKNRLKEAT
jgi:diguanylate cyclase (GGDEF)-like protein